ncbi:hypothetical protein GW17_00021894 [Ensete ventricosum]|nr:hypothetical protein GW17_00021894 [Ensete ventricosum]
MHNSASAGPPAKPRVGSSQVSEASLKRKRGVFQKDCKNINPFLFLLATYDVWVWRRSQLPSTGRRNRLPAMNPAGAPSPRARRNRLPPILRSRATNDAGTSREATQKPSPCLFLFDNCCSPATIVVATSRCPVVLPALLLNSTNHCRPSPAIASLGLQQPQPSLIAPDVDATTSSASLSAFLYRRRLLLLPTPSSTTCSPRSLHIVAAAVLSTRAQQCRRCFSLPIHIALNCTLLFPFSLPPLQSCLPAFYRNRD